MPSPKSTAMYCVFTSTTCNAGAWGVLAGDGLAETCYQPTTITFDAPPAVDAPVIVVDGPTGTAKLATDAKALDFGAVVTAMPGTERTLTVSNAGVATTGAIDWNLAGPNPDDFSIGADSCKGATLTPGASCTIDVVFAPAAMGARSATLGVVAQPGGLVLVTLGGSGLLAGALSIAPTMQDFGTALEGAEGGEFSFTVRNTAETTSGTVSVTLARGSDFTITTNGCTDVLAGAASCTVKVRFQPGAPGEATDSLVATDGNGNAAAQLVGRGLAAASLTMTPPSLDFGMLSIGAHTASMDFTLRNAGGALTGAPVVTLSDPQQFALAQNGCTAALAPGASCTISVAFTPTGAAGGKSATLSAAATPGGVAMSSLGGTALGAGSVQLGPTDHGYGSIDLGSQSGEVPYTVTNGGGTEIGPLSIGITGPAASSFSVTANDCPATLGGGATCQVGVTFTPQAVGALAATLGVSAPSAGGAAAALSGTGTASLTVVRNGAGTVTSDPTGISCGSTCAASFGTSPVTLTATADALSDFGGWQGAGCSGTGPCVVTLDGAQTVTANFTLRPPTLGLGPSSKDFGSATLGGQTTPVTFTVQNGGGAASGTITASVSDTASYTVTGGTCPGATVAAGASCTVIVRFNPSGSAGSKPATLTVMASPGGNATASLSGTALSAGALSIGPGSKDFSQVAVGAASGETVFTVTNTGQSKTGTVGATLSDTTSFTISSNTCGAALDANGTCTIGVKLTPGSVGAKSSSLTVTASPGGSTAASLSGTGNSVLTVTNAGGGTVTSGDGLINCGATCMATFTAEPVVLTATPDGTHTFGGWMGACSGTGGCSVALDAGTKSVTAVFTPTGALTVNFAGSGAGTVSSSPQGISCTSECFATFPPGTMVTLTATPSSGSYFQGWSSGACSGSLRFCTVTLNGAKSTTAVFSLQTANTVFVSSATYTGNLGGLTGADLKCNQLAAASGLSGNYVALLSDGTTDAIDRLTGARGFVRVDGAPIGDEPSSLFAPTQQIFNALDLDENGAVVDSSVWTGTTEDGTLLNQTASCGNWSNGISTSHGAIGSTASGPGGWVRHGQNSACSNLNHIYCFMTDRSATISGSSTIGKRLFVTNSEFVPGGGITSANTLCDSSKPTGAASVVAFLATTTIPASTLLNLTATYVRVDGQLVGTGQEIIAGAMHSGVWQAGNGQYDQYGVWTGSSAISAVGSASGTCNDWTMTSSTTGIIGTPNDSLGSLFGNGSTVGCANITHERLLCIEQ